MYNNNNSSFEHSYILLILLFFFVLNEYLIFLSLFIRGEDASERKIWNHSLSSVILATGEQEWKEAIPFLLMILNYHELLGGRREFQNRQLLLQCDLSPMNTQEHLHIYQRVELGFFCHACHLMSLLPVGAAVFEFSE